MPTLNAYTGSTLRIGSFLEMMQELSRLIAEKTPTALKLDAEAPAFVAKVVQLEALVKRIRAFEETATVAAEDQTRDAIWRAIYYLHHYLKGLPETHPLYLYVTRLTPVFNTYKNLHRSELMEQTAETRGFLSEMSKQANAEAAAQLGMDVLIPLLENANEAITTANASRTTTAADRQAELGNETTDEVRKQLVTLYRNIVERVNAANIFFPSDTITSFIQRANSIADHYRVIAAASINNSGSGGGTASPDPSQGGGNEGGGTGNSGNSGESGGSTGGNEGGDTPGTGGDSGGGDDNGDDNNGPIGDAE